MKRSPVLIYTLCMLAWLTSSLSQAEQPQTPLSLQLWSVKDALREDFEGTLDQIAAMGFEGVEFAGDYGPYANNPAGLRQRLQNLGLAVSGVHVGLNQLQGEQGEKNLAFFKALGTELVIVPWDERAWNADHIVDLIADLTSLNSRLAEQQLRFGFHNHQYEFGAFQQATFWDYLARHTPADMVLQLDVGWVRFAGADPFEYIRRYAGRTLSAHLKIVPQDGDGLSPIIGRNQYDWAALVQALQTVGKSQWLVLEQEVYPEDVKPLAAVKLSLQGLRAQLALARH